MVRRILESKVVVVSGGTSGIGKASALLMAEAGAAVAIGGLRMTDCQAVADEIAARGGKAIAVELDVRSEESARTAVETTVTTFGRIDALFNPAGTLKQAPVATCTPSDWDDVVAVHAGGHANILSAVIPIMRNQGSGRIITVSSGAAIDGIGELAAYATAKSAILGMTRALAAELAESGVTVNSISPTAHTLMSRDVPPGDDSPIPARFRRREAEQVAAFVSYLASDRSAGVSGRLFMTSGGHTIEFDAPRPLKQIQVTGDASVDAVRDDLTWIQRRPSATSISRRPTRDYFLLGSTSGAPEAVPPRTASAGGPILFKNAPPELTGAFVDSKLRTARADETAVGAVLFPLAPAKPDVMGVTVAWQAAAPVVRDMFLNVQNAARRLATGATIVVVLPPRRIESTGLIAETLSAALLGLARSAASSLAGSGIHVHAVHAPENSEDFRTFAQLIAALIGNTVVSTGGIFDASRGHVVSFVPEMPAWQHFGDAQLTDAWLDAVDAAVRSRGARWSTARHG